MPLVQDTLHSVQKVEEDQGEWTILIVVMMNMRRVADMNLHLEEGPHKVQIVVTMNTRIMDMARVLNVNLAMTFIHPMPTNQAEGTVTIVIITTMITMIEGMMMLPEIGEEEEMMICILLQDEIEGAKAHTMTMMSIMTMMIPEEGEVRVCTGLEIGSQMKMSIMNVNHVDVLLHDLDPGQVDHHGEVRAHHVQGAPDQGR